MKRKCQHLKNLDNETNPMAIGAAQAVCNQIESAHHGQEWKNRRGLSVKHMVNSNADADGNYIKNKYQKLEDMYEKHNMEMHPRMLEVTTDKYGCSRDLAAGWSSAVAINSDTGLPWCGTDDGQNWCYCDCENGMIWDVDGNYCHPTHWNSAEVNPQLTQVVEYFDKLTDKLIAESIYVKDKDSLLDVFDRLILRECELLYNKKGNLTMVDEIHKENSYKSRFLNGWGLQAEVANGAGDDPCDGVGAKN